MFKTLKKFFTRNTFVYEPIPEHLYNSKITISKANAILLLACASASLRVNKLHPKQVIELQRSYDTVLNELKKG